MKYTTDSVRSRFHPYVVPAKEKKCLSYTLNKFLVWCENNSVQIKYLINKQTMSVRSLYNDAYFLAKFFLLQKQNINTFLKLSSKFVNWKRDNKSISWRQVLDMYTGNFDSEIVYLKKLKPFTLPVQELTALPYTHDELEYVLGESASDGCYYYRLDGYDFKLEWSNEWWYILFDIEINTDTQLDLIEIFSTWVDTMLIDFKQHQSTLDSLDLLKI